MQFRKLSFAFLDVALVVLSVAMTIYLKFDFSFPKHYYEHVTDFIPLAVSLNFVFSLMLGVYRNNLDYFGFHEIFKQFMASVCVLSGLFFIKFTGEMELSGSIILMYTIIYYVLSCVIRSIPHFHRLLFRPRGKKQKNRKKVLIIGAGTAASIVAQQMRNDPKSEFLPVGYLDDDRKKHDSSLAGVRVLGFIHQTAYFANLLKVDEILIAVPSANKKDLAVIFDSVSNAGLPTKIFQNAIDVKAYQQGNENVLKKMTIDDLLFQETIETKIEAVSSLLEGKVVMVTGGAGAIGRELCLQMLENGCKHLVIFDVHESGLVQMNEALKEQYLYRFTTVQGSVRDGKRLETVFEKYRPEYVFHAAASKHMRMMEANPFEGVKDNIFGTEEVLKQAVAYRCKKFVLISTEKAENPRSIMGATKRISEILGKVYENSETKVISVRFGSVLGANGMIFPLFQKQIEEGGPVTVADKEVSRRFINIKEAVSLVLYTGVCVQESGLYLLDMGRAVKLYEIALNMIRLSGKVPFQEVDIQLTGLKLGEALVEGTSFDGNTMTRTNHEKVFMMKENTVVQEDVLSLVERLKELTVAGSDEEAMREVLFQLSER